MSGLTDEKIQLTKVQEKYEKWVGKFYLQRGRDIVELSGMLRQETWHSLHPHNQFPPTTLCSTTRNFNWRHNSDLKRENMCMFREALVYQND